MKKVTIANLIEKTKWRRDACIEKQHEFIASFEKDPVHALIWSHEHFQNVAKNHAYLSLETMLEKKLTITQIRKYFVDEYTRGARNPENSTSPTSNLMKQCLTSAYVDICEDLDEIEEIIYE